MLVPCIDLQDSRAVQLVHGRKRRLAVDDVLGLVKKFSVYSRLHVIDLDAAMRKGSNARLVREVCKAARHAGMHVRVGGGIRSVAHARRVASWGAEKIIVGSAAFRNGRVNHAFLRRLVAACGRRRVMLALDTERGHVVVRGWKERLRLKPRDVLAELEPYASEFLCTYVDTSLRRATRLPITAAGGIRSRLEIRSLERIKMDAAVGMALYLGKIS
jgi:phosphoribosylformimino-5-aminoimidazole carboxamide ribonucleotide (ProFAR) isomerase